MAKKPKVAAAPSKPPRLEHLPRIPNGLEFMGKLNELVDAVNAIRQPQLEHVTERSTGVEYRDAVNALVDALNELRQGA